MADYVWTGKEFIMLAIGWIVGWIIPTPPHMYKWWLGAGEREETLKCVRNSKQMFECVHPIFQVTLLHRPHYNQQHMNLTPFLLSARSLA